MAEKVSPRWRRLWGIRPGELNPPVHMIGGKRVMGEPQSGPHGRGWMRWFRRHRAEP